MYKAGHKHSCWFSCILLAECPLSMGLNVHAIKWHLERVLKGEALFPITAVLKVYLALEPLEVFIVWKKK